MAIKKSELYSSLWKSCDELRGGMDASQYKDYVLVLLFVKYVSDKYAGKPDANIIIPEGGSFKDMIALKGTKDIGEGINKIIAKLAEPNDLKRVIDVANFNDDDKLGKGKEMVDKLSNLIAIFQNDSLDFSKNKAEGDDILGDAYEYLMRHFATESGKSKGKGAIILPHGVLFRGNAEAEIRKNIIRKGFIKGIIGLPANLFYGTGIPACIIVLDKENADGRRGIFMIDASRGFVKDGNKNRLRDQDIHKIVDVFNKQTEVPKYARMVTVDEIERNEYNLNIPRYIDSQEAEDIQNIEAHLSGDIPNRDIEDLENYWKVYPSLKNVLFTKSPRAGYSKLRILHEEIKHVIFAHPEFTSYIKEIDVVFNSWKEKHTLTLKSLVVGAKPKEVIRNLSEAILTSFADRKLIDQYDVYQHLMTYWSDTMQDDAYLIAVDGWKAELTQRKKDEWDCDLVPKQLVIKRYFAAEQKVQEQLEADRDAISRQMEELEEEHSGEEGLLEEVRTDKGKVTKVLIQKRVKEIKKDADAAEELKVLEIYLKLIEKEAEANKKIKDAQTMLDKKVMARYKTFTEDDVKTLVVDDKWMAAISQDVKSELERISQRLTQRIKELAERYATPMPELNAKVDELETKVSKHLGKMGFVS